MANSKSALANSPEKNASASAHQQHKQHSTPFYISSALFHNKRLKHKRCMWTIAPSKETARRVVSAAPSAASSLVHTTTTTSNRKRRFTKTDSNKRRQQPPPPQPLQANITIDLLSDDEEDAPPPPKVPKHNAAPRAPPEFQHFYVCPGDGGLELSRAPNITLVPVQQLTPPRARLTTKRKRKSKQPQRHAQPTIVNNDAIVLTDDDDSETEKPATVAAAVLQKPPPSPPSLPQKIVIASAQVDEEVTVSIVPRSATAGSCAAAPKPKATSADKEALFPMLPDETTVHTVIANRIYELSLTKLREGLAACGVSEFGDGQPKPTKGGRQKIQTYAPPASVVSPPQQAPISLKLSSDLSISLISDDEEDAVEAHRHAQKVLRAQPQLSVQVQVPRVASNARQPPPPRRPKLG